MKKEKGIIKFSNILDFYSGKKLKSPRVWKKGYFYFPVNLDIVGTM